MVKSFPRDFRANADGKSTDKAARPGLLFERGIGSFALFFFFVPRRLRRRSAQGQGTLSQAAGYLLLLLLSLPAAPSGVRRRSRKEKLPL